MAEAFVVDTNVLIVASAADLSSSCPPDFTPVDDPDLRQQVLDWLWAFEEDPEQLLALDYGWHIRGEYQNKLSEQNYGWKAIMAKFDRGEVVLVGIEVDKDGHAILDGKLQQKVADRADRKMVAVALKAAKAGHSSSIVNASDSDWVDCAADLSDAGITVRELLPEWIQKKWHDNRHRK